jgi:hypothetical protein
MERPRKGDRMKTPAAVLAAALVLAPARVSDCATING